MKVIQKTWNDFWGEFLLITFHKYNPDRWNTAKSRAEWIMNTAQLHAGARILDLGCGSGLIDICLADIGAQVTAIDRIKPVLDIAQSEAAGRTVKFTHGELREIKYPDNSFDCVLILETIGLMSKKDDRNLIENSFRFLAKGGKLLIDCPNPSNAKPNYWTKDFPEGKLKFEVSYDAPSFVQTIIPTLTKDNEVIELNDPYNKEIQKHAGVKRYLYPANELKKIMESIGFKVIETAHIWGNDYYLQIGVKP